MPLGSAKVREIKSPRRKEIKSKDIKNNYAARRIAKKSALATSAISHKPATKKRKKISLKEIFRATPARQRLTEADLINAESALGATLFGPVPNGHRREFFRFQHNIWIYHESWTENGKHLESTITYEVRENGVYKLPLGGQYIKIKGTELENFRKAVKEYAKLIKAKLY